MNAVDKFYVASKHERENGITLRLIDSAPDARDPRDRFAIDQNGRIYSAASYGYTMLDYHPAPGVIAQWCQLSGVKLSELVNMSARRDASWNSDQFDRDVEKLHIEAKRLGFRCVEVEGTGNTIDTLRRLFDENGKPTGFVKNERTGTMIREDVDQPLPTVAIPTPINNQSGLRVVSKTAPQAGIFQTWYRKETANSRPWWRKLLDIRINVSIFDKGGPGT